MAATQNFRSAFNGFNREDVVQYIQYINTKHTEEVNQLRSEVEFLQEKIRSIDPATVQLLADAEKERDDYKKQLDEALSVKEALEARCSELEAERDNALCQESDTADVKSLEAQILSLQQELGAALEAKAAAQAKAEESSRSTAFVSYRIEQELEAYRRAERTERIARERAEQVYRVTNGVLAEATVRVDDAAARIGEMSDQVVTQLNLLQAAVSGSKQALKDAAASMSAIRPGYVEE